MDKNNQAIVYKIQELSEQRRLLPFATALGISSKKFNELAVSLENLQYAIFSIDTIYEQHWEITELLQKEVDQYRRYIYQYCDQMVPDTEYLNAYIRNLRAFRDMELSTRKGISLLDWSLDEFYHLKICDIQLQGMCILWTSGQTLSQEIYNAIEAYDMLGEVLDDVLDRTEDIGTNNPNRLLAEIQEVNLESALEKFQGFVQELIHKAMPYEKALLGYGLNLSQYVDVWQQQLNLLKSGHITT